MKMSHLSPCLYFVQNSQVMEHILLILLAQLWRFNDYGQLENKLRRWKYEDRNVSIDPKDANEGFIQLHENGKVLTLKNIYTKEVGFEEKYISVIESQTWKLGPIDKSGWRTILNPNSGFYLTSTLEGGRSISNPTVATKGMRTRNFFCKIQKLVQGLGRPGVSRPACQYDRINTHNCNVVVLKIQTILELMS